MTAQGRWKALLSRIRVWHCPTRGRFATYSYTANLLGAQPEMRNANKGAHTNATRISRSGACKAQANIRRPRAHHRANRKPDAPPKMAASASVWCNPTMVSPQKITRTDARRAPAPCRRASPCPCHRRRCRAWAPRTSGTSAHNHARNHMTRRPARRGGPSNWCWNEMRARRTASGLSHVPATLGATRAEGTPPWC